MFFTSRGKWKNKTIPVVLGLLLVSCASGGGWSALVFREWTSVDIYFSKMAILKLRKREKQTADASDKVLYLNQGERVAYGECNANDTLHQAGDWDVQTNEAVMLWEYGRVIRASKKARKVTERERHRGRQRWAFLMLRLRGTKRESHPPPLWETLQQGNLRLRRQLQPPLVNMFF